MKKLLLVMTLGVLSGCFGESDDTEELSSPIITADFSTEKDDLKVTFTSTSTSAGSLIDSYQWDFGDDSVINFDTNPIYTYATADTYSVLLTVTTEGGSSASVTRDVTVAKIPGTPTADFTYSPDGLTVTFTDSSAVTNDTIANHSWNFGDVAPGNTSALASPSHTYTASGDYDVTLSVNSELGNKTATVSYQVTVTDNVVDPVNPQADFSSVVNDLEVTFTDLTSVDNGSITDYLWDFGDSASSALASPSHLYAAGGTYTVRLDVTGSDGTTASNSKEVTAYDPAIEPTTPTVSFTADALEVSPNLTVNFTADAANETSPITTYAWDFDSLGVSSAANPTFTFANAGLYTVALTVTSEEGIENSYSDNVEVFSPVVEQPEYIACQVTSTTSSIIVANRNEELASCFSSDTSILDKALAATWCAVQVSTYITDMPLGRFRPTLTANVLETACP
ncbi:cell surface protein [Moritella sp. PE36]|uniref:PKD domain-containing protein n=1 Tax=Moritella sp. PE36 TaxID=58051 RepID=UPI0001568286|nr:PKD domain-containing protein [Moritella sp. PE36]EDM68633.1 cell surface protein [Moritella sp. PE36]